MSRRLIDRQIVGHSKRLRIWRFTYHMWPCVEGDKHKWIRCDVFVHPLKIDRGQKDGHLHPKHLMSLGCWNEYPIR